MPLGSVMKQNKKARNRYAYENHEHDVPPAPSGYVRHTQHWEGEGANLREQYTNIYPSLLRFGRQEVSVRDQKTVDALPREKIYGKRLSCAYYSRYGTWRSGYIGESQIFIGTVNGISFRMVYGIKNLATFTHLEHQFFFTYQYNVGVEQGVPGFKFRWEPGDTSFTLQLWRDGAVYDSHQFSVPLVDDHVYAIEFWGQGTSWTFRLYSPSLGQSDTKEFNNVADMKILRHRTGWDVIRTAVDKDDPETFPELWMSHSEHITHPLGG